MKKRYHNLLILALALVAALFNILAFPEFDAFYLAFFAYVPIFIILEIEKNFLKTIIAIEFFVLVFYGYLLYWIEVFHPLALPGVLIYLLVIYPIPFMVYRMVKRSNRTSFANVLLITVCLTIFENLRNLGFMKFPYGNLAYSQYNFTSFIQIAEYVGPLGISMLLYFTNACIASFILKAIHLHKKKNKLTILQITFNRVSLSLVMVILVYLFGSYQLDNFLLKDSLNKHTSNDEENISVGLVQPWFDYNKPWNIETKDELYNKLTKQTLNLADENLDLIIWPESAILDYYDFQIKSNFNQLSVAREFYNFFNAYGKQYPKTYFLVGSSDFEFVTNQTVTLDSHEPRSAKDAKTSFFDNVKKYNSALLINNEGEVVGKRGKANLVAFAEYFPYKWVFNYLPFLEKALSEAHASNFSPYEGYNVMQIPKGSFSTLICYDSVFPELSRLLVLKGAKFLVVITNDAWSYSTRSQVIHYAFSIFRAIENRTPVVRVGNAGVTTLIEPNGLARIDTDNLDKLEMFKEASTTASFSIKKHEITFYSLYGNLLNYVVMIIIIVYYFGVIGLIILPWNMIKKIVSFFKNIRLYLLSKSKSKKNHKENSKN